MRAQKIRTKSDQHTLEIGGWLDGKLTYLWLGDDGRCMGTLSGQRLYRLAKAIVRHFESPDE